MNQETLGQRLRLDATIVCRFQLLADCMICLISVLSTNVFQLASQLNFLLSDYNDVILVLEPVIMGIDLKNSNRFYQKGKIGILEGLVKYTLFGEL